MDQMASLFDGNDFFVIVSVEEMWGGKCGCVCRWEGDVVSGECGKLISSQRSQQLLSTDRFSPTRPSVHLTFTPSANQIKTEFFPKGRQRLYGDHLNSAYIPWDDWSTQAEYETVTNNIRTDHQHSRWPDQKFETRDSPLFPLFLLFCNRKSFCCSSCSHLHVVLRTPHSTQPWEAQVYTYAATV